MRVHTGFTLIELSVALVILGALLAIGAPVFNTWIKSAQIRTAAEAIQNGLQLARGEAVRRNDLIRFQLTSSVGNDCVLSTTASNWIVSYDDPSSACASGAFVNDAFPVSDPGNNPAPRLLQVRSAAEGSREVLVAANQSAVNFNGLGRIFDPLNALTPPTPITIDVMYSSAGDCRAGGGAFRCLRVTVSANGQIRMCDPAYPTGTAGTDPQRCD